ncbi:MAG: hypothetical protein F4Y71_08070 [Acidobacteria bacterium]|nr:hypothetical protein [Acidobacteriota bacterium]MYG74126.1 hypothetical protein [Acidobacteriota bacterium]
MSRIHILINKAQKVRYQSHAARERKSLGAWMREAAEEKIARSAPRRFASVQEFDAFVAECQARSAADGGLEREPDWEETKKIILDSKIRGLEEFL